MPPVSGATWPILTSCAAGAASAAGLLSPLAAGFLSPQPTSAIATAISAMLNLLFMGSPGGLPLEGANDTAPSWRKRRSGLQRCDYFCDRIHFTSARTSASGTEALGGIGTWPQVPWLPFFTLSTSFASAPGSLRYFAPTSL